MGRSSLTRWKILSEWKDSLRDPGVLGMDDLVRTLSSHRGAPYSPCRHAREDAPGATLLTACFHAPGRSVRIYEGQPCRGVFQDLNPLVVNP